MNTGGRNGMAVKHRTFVHDTDIPNVDNITVLRWSDVTRHSAHLTGVVAGHMFGWRLVCEVITRDGG